MTKKTKTCAYCKKEQASSEQGIYPFCSKRCKMDDLDNWAAGRYAIKGSPTSELENSENEENDFQDLTKLK